MEVVPGTRHGDVEQTPLLFDLSSSADAKVRRNAAIDRVQHKHRLPFLSFGRVYG
jgi:hypothetical protein